MRNFGAFLSALVILMPPVLCRAGVVLDEQLVISQANSNNVTRYRTTMIEGNKEKSIIDNSQRIIITDLKKGTRTVVDETRKTYVEFPFPPKSGQNSAMQGSTLSTVSFKKTGGHDTISGYSCDVYSGSGTAGGNAVSVTGCFSDSAPGASDYTNFQREMTDKLKGAAIASVDQIPPGIPLILSIATTPNLPMAGMSPDRAAKLKQMLADRQLVTSAKIYRITTKSLPADSFQVPAGYQKQQLPPRESAMSGHPSVNPQGKVPK